MKKIKNVKTLNENFVKLFTPVENYNNKTILYMAVWSMLNKNFNIVV